MKKAIYLFISLFLLMNYSFSQKASLGIHAGITLATFKASIEDVSVTSKTKAGISAGLNLVVPISKSFSFRPELNFVQKGGTMKEEDYKETLTLNYIQVPLNFTYNMPTSSGSFFIGAGPSVNLGISGKDKWHDGTESGSSKVKFGSGDDADFKMLEISANLMAGYQFSGGFFVTAGYNAGLSDASNDDPEFDGSYHNRYFGVNIGYMFGSKPKSKEKSQDQ